MATTQHPVRRRTTGGPPLALVGGVSLALFVASLVAVAAWAGGTVPSPFSAETTVVTFFRDNRHAVQVMAFLQFGSAIPLAIYAATASARLRNLGIRAPGATIALVGGVVSATFLALSALVTWTLTQAGVTTDATLTRALSDLSFAAGGPGHVVPLGLLLAGIAVPAAFTGLLPRALVVIGLVLAVIAELSTLVLVVQDLAFLLPIGRFGGLLWLIVAGALLPHDRDASRATTPTPVTVPAGQPEGA